MSKYAILVFKHMIYKIFICNMYLYTYLKATEQVTSKNLYVKLCWLEIIFAFTAPFKFCTLNI